MPNTVRLHRVLAMASPGRMTAIGDWLSGRCWPIAVSMNAVAEAKDFEGALTEAAQ